MSDEVTVTQIINVVEATTQSNKVVVQSGSLIGPPGPQGVQGATGQTGPQGPQGTPGTATVTPALFSFKYEQQSDSTVWTIAHNLGYQPAVAVQDYGRISLEGDVQYIDVNNLTITFSIPVSGYAYLT